MCLKKTFEKPWTNRQRTIFRLILMCRGRSVGMFFFEHDMALGKGYLRLQSHLTYCFPLQTKVALSRSSFLFSPLYRLWICTRYGASSLNSPLLSPPPSHVYAALVRIHDIPIYNMHSIFAPGFPGLLEAIYVQERITQQMMPDVYAAFKKHMISTTSYATKWYITLFANSVPWQTQLRLWDVFLLEGQDVFVAVAVAVLWVYRG